MQKISARRILFWGGFALFVLVAVATHWSNDLWQFSGATGRVRAGLIAVWAGFTCYSIYCIPRESLWRSAQEIMKLFWGKQVTADLYISVFLSIGLVWLVTGSLMETFLWSLAFLPFANLAILLFLILHIGEIMHAFGLG